MLFTVPYTDEKSNVSACEHETFCRRAFNGHVSATFGLIVHCCNVVETVDHTVHLHFSVHHTKVMFHVHC